MILFIVRPSGIPEESNKEYVPKSFPSLMEALSYAVDLDCGYIIDRTEDASAE